MLTKCRVIAPLCIVLAVATGSACGSSGPDLGSGSTNLPASTTAAAAPKAKATHKAKPKVTATEAAEPGTGGGPVKIAFGGDVHFAGSSAAALGGDLGSAATQLKAADIGMVNLETAITTRGTAAPKQYTFRAPAAALGVLRRSGIDVVTVANNHGMDYGRVGLADTLAASKRYGLPIVGAGAVITAAYTPYRKTVRGVKVAIFGATDVLDTFAITTWPATDTESGLASAKDPDLLLAAVRSAAADSDIVVVDLHWGVELQSCPTSEQKQLVRQLTDAGADIVVGSHAHVLGPNVQQDHTAVHFGLGNFVFYAHGGAPSQSGVYTVTVDRSGVLDTTWTPAVISGGRPQLLTGSSAATASAAETALGRHCAVT